MSSKRLFLCLFCTIFAFGDVLLVSRAEKSATERALAERGDNPSMALLSNKVATNRQCGATVLSPSLALTFTDCCLIEAAFWHISDLYLTAGSTQLTIPPPQTSGGPVQSTQLGYRIHPDVGHFANRRNKNEFCMLQLVHPLKFFDKDLGPVAGIYSIARQPAAGTTFTAYGWYSNHTDSKPPFLMTLHKNPCTVIEWEDCLDHFPGMDPRFTFCCRTPDWGLDRFLSTAANQLMAQNATGHLFLAGQQLRLSRSDRAIGLYQTVSRAYDWISGFTGPLPTIDSTTATTTPAAATTTTTTTTTPAPTPTTTTAPPKPGPVTPTAVGRGEDPSMGIMYSSKVYWYHCGGTVVGPKLVFITADCCVPTYSWWTHGQLPQNDFSFTGGATHLTARQTSEKGPVQTRTSRYYVHPQRSGKYKNNYCMLELDNPLTFFGNDLAPAELYHLDTGEMRPKVGTPFIVFRWTTADRGPPYRMTLEKVGCTAMSWEDCLKSYPGADHGTTFCCNTRNPDAQGKIESNQLMFQNATGHLLLVGHQLTYGADPAIGLFNLASRVVDWVKNPK